MIVDAVIVALIVLAILRGLRRGAAVQLVAFVSFLIGLGVGAALVVVVAPHVPGQLAKTFTSLGLLLIPASALGEIGAHLGRLIGGALRRIHFGALDAAIGIVVSVAGTLVLCWLFGSILVNSSYSALSSQIESSRIIKAVQGVMPPIPDAFASVERFLSAGGFPQVLVNILPESTGPVVMPNAVEVNKAAAIAAPATIKIVALGCGDEQEGSGFIAARVPEGDLIVTNAHVVAGTTAISVHLADGRVASAQPVLFDPRFDLAILRTAPLGISPLPVSASYVERGTSATELGFPEGGPFTADGAGILARFAAQGRDIYDRSLTVRTVYELQATVRPGNSGGPLVSGSGVVEGVVFSRSASHDNIGFALASPGVLARIDIAKSQATRPVSTQGCTT